MKWKLRSPMGSVLRMAIVVATWLMPSFAAAAGEAEGDRAKAKVTIGLPALDPYARDGSSGAGEAPAGFLVDVWRRAGELAGLDVVFRVGNEAQIHAWLDAGEIDLHGGFMLGGGDRGLRLGRPVAVQCQGVFSTGAPLVFERWRDRRLLMTEALIEAGLFEEFGARISAAESLSSAVEALGEGRVDLIAGPLQATALALQEAGLEVELKRLHCPWMVPAAPARNAPLMDRLLRALAQLEPAEWRAFDAQWRAPAAPSLLAPAFDVKEAELSWLASHASVRLGASKWVPMTEIGPDGAWTGLGLETVRAIFHKIGVLVTFGGDPDWLQVVADTEAGLYDGLGYTRADDAKRAFLAFTQSVVSSSYIIANRIDAPFLRDLEDLAGARLAVIQHYGIVDWLRQTHPEVELVLVDDAASGLRLLSEGGVEAYMDILPAVTQVTNRLGLNNVKLATRLQVSSNMAIGVRREWPELVSLLERSIEATGEAELQRIYREWDAVRFERPPSRREVLRAAAWLVSPLILLLIALGIRLIQQRRRAMASKKQLQLQVLQLQKLEALGTLAKGVSHEFNNILQAILGYADIAAQPRDELERERSLNRIVTSAIRAQDIVGQILSFSHRQKVERRSLDLVPVLEEAWRLLRASLPAKVDISLSVEESPCFISGEPAQIKQILMNLATNASEAMPDGGHMEISLTPIDDPEGIQVITGALGKGRFWRLAVCDEGVGIHPDDQVKIFDPFFTTRELGESSGLGLSVVHGIVAAHEGGIRVGSAPGQGACFEVFLPRSEEIGEKESQHVADQPASYGQQQRILVVDDEVFLTDILERCLEGCGYSTRVFNESAVAVEAFMADPAGFDLVLSDLNMPGYSGEQLAEKVSALRPDIPIIIMTGYSSQTLYEPLARGTIRQVLEKPVRPSDLLDAVSQELGA